MRFIKLAASSTGHYCYKDASDIAMNILGSFFSSDVRCTGRTFFKDWALSDENEWAVTGNITVLDKEGDFIYLADQYSEEDEPTELKMTRQQFVQLLDEWQEKVCKHKPKTVVIKHENDQFTIETSDNEN